MPAAETTANGPDVDYVMSVRATSGGAFVADSGPTLFLCVPPDQQPVPSQKIRAADWYKRVQAAGTWRTDTNQERGDILFVIHGFNTSEAEVMERHRRIRRGLEARQFKGVVVSFDWPSSDSALAYLTDRHRAKVTALQLVTDGIMQLSKMQTPDCAVNVHLLGHSTGAYVIREAFDDADDTAMRNSAWSVSQVLMIGGDVSSDSMSEDNPGAESIYNHCVRLTNYQSRHDAVLDLSNVKRVGVAPRVGRVGLPPDAPSKAINVDCTGYYEQLTGDPQVMATDMQDGKTVGAECHSWHFGNAVFTRDLFSTLIGIDRLSMPTRQVYANGQVVLTR